jgi:acetyl esterase/lipase
MLRALLSAVSVVILLPIALVITAGFFPRLPTIGVLAALINTGLPWLFVGAAIATGLAGIAVVLGGNKTIVLFLAALAVLLGTGGIGYRYITTASAQGGSYDLVRAITGSTAAVHPHQSVAFATVEGVDLHAGIWLPAAAAAAAPATMPAVVFVHGGAFVGGSLDARPDLLGAIARAGIVAVDVEYRLAPPPRWDQAPADVLCALAWLPNAAELAMVDPERVVLVGESAGGSLALMAGYGAGTDQLASSCPDQGAPLIPAGVLAIAPAADLEGIWNDATLYDGRGSRFPEAYIGGPPSAYPERYEAAEPFRLLRADLPPTLILAGEADRLVRVEHATSLVAQIRAAGAQCDLVVAPFADHGFEGEPNSFGAQLAEALVPDFVFRVAPTSS